MIDTPTNQATISWSSSIICLLMKIDGKVDKMYTFLLKSLSMKFKEYIDRTHVFTVSQLAESCGMSDSSAKTTLRRAVAAGQIERARRGVYVSKSGRFAAAEVDSFELVSSIDPKAVISFHSAPDFCRLARSFFARLPRPAGFFFVKFLRLYTPLYGWV